MGCLAYFSSSGHLRQPGSTRFGGMLWGAVGPASDPASREGAVDERHALERETAC
jgi:hypothetical protein